MKTRILGFVGLVAVIGAASFALFVVPADLNQGDAQRIMYVHVPSAWLAYLVRGHRAGGTRLPVEARPALRRGGRRGRRDRRALHRARHLGRDDVGSPGVGRLLAVGGPAAYHHALLLALYIGYLLFRRLTDDPVRRAGRAAVVG